MSRIDDKELERIEALEKTATPGKWETPNDIYTQNRPRSIGGEMNFDFGDRMGGEKKIREFLTLKDIPGEMGPIPAYTVGCRYDGDDDTRTRFSFHGTLITQGRLKANPGFFQPIYEGFKVCPDCGGSCDFTGTDKCTDCHCKTCHGKRVVPVEVKKTGADYFKKHPITAKEIVEAFGCDLSFAEKMADTFNQHNFPVEEKAKQAPCPLHEPVGRYKYLNCKLCHNTGYRPYDWPPKEGQEIYSVGINAAGTLSAFTHPEFRHQPSNSQLPAKYPTREIAQEAADGANAVIKRVRDKYGLDGEGK